MSRKFVLEKSKREAIAKKISDEIIERGYKSFREFAKEYNIPTTTLQNWKTTGNINLAFLIRFAEDFQLDLRWLIKGKPYPKWEKPHINK
ncbi:bacteriophage CI repressor [Candidatus Poribacteria bacterium]|nr:bacteriophage CI repressor [Candidatus Poribacteria bacterium]